MSNGDALAVGLGAAIGAIAVVAPWVLRRLPEPEPTEPEPTGPDEQLVGDVADAGGRLSIAPVDQKVLYRDLAGRGGLAPALGVLGALLGGGAGAALGWSSDLAVVLPLIPIGVLLGYIDARTTFLPTRLIAPAYVLVILAILGGSVVQGDWSDLVRAVAGWALYGGFLGAGWWFLGAYGYGDVRLAGVLGLALGWLGWTQLAVGVFLAHLLGGVLGLVLVALKVVDRRRNPFGPYLLLGFYLAALAGPEIAAGLGY